jgi:hypothetical protein
MTGFDTTDFDTTYFDQETVKKGVNGCCQLVALALHRRTGWPIAAIWRDPVIDEYTIMKEPRLVHVCVVAPDGRALDVEGAIGQEALHDRYAEAYRKNRWGSEKLRLVVHGSEEDWAKAVVDAEAFEVLASEFAVNDAMTVLEPSPKFMALLEELGHREPARAPAAP